MAWCEADSVDDVFGLTRNERLVAAIAAELAAAGADSSPKSGARAASRAGAAHAGQREPRAPGGREGRAPAQGRGSLVFAPSFSAARFMRALSMRTSTRGRGREPDQRAAARPFADRTPRRRCALMSCVAVAFFAYACRGAAPDRAQAYPVRDRDLRHDPLKLEDRRPGAPQRARIKSPRPSPVPTRPSTTSPTST